MKTIDMNKILFSILGAFMVSTMASAQYLNVKLDDGTYHSYKTSSKTEVSFGAKAGTEVLAAQPVTVGGHKVTVMLAENTPASEVVFSTNIEGDAVKIKAVSLGGYRLKCTRDDNVVVSDSEVSNGFYTFSLFDISKDVVATVEYVPNNFLFDLLSHGGTAPEGITLLPGTAINVTPTANDGYEFRGWYMEPSCENEWSWDLITAKNTDDITLYAKWIKVINGRDCVKLGGYYWATENVRGSGTGYSPITTDDTYGDYYTLSDNNALNAAESWGSTWTLPSDSQFQALLDNCTWTWKSSYPYKGNSVPGMFVTGTSEGEIGHSIFLPAAGIYYNVFSYVDEQGYDGYYWSTDDRYLHFNSSFRTKNSRSPKDGLAVRPVSE